MLLGQLDPVYIERLLRTGRAMRKLPWSCSMFHEEAVVHDILRREGITEEATMEETNAFPVPPPMMALTVKRPWPLAFLRYGKRVENRGWRLPDRYLGVPIALHAGVGWDEEGARVVEDMLAFHVGERKARDWLADLAIEPYLPGSVFAVAVFDRCRQYDFLSTVLNSNMEDPFAFGPYCWHVERFAALARPVPCRGRQRLWRLSCEDEAAVMRQLPAGFVIPTKR